MLGWKGRDQPGSMWAYRPGDDDDLCPAAVAETCRGYRAAPAGGSSAAGRSARDLASRAGWQCAGRQRNSLILRIGV